MRLTLQALSLGNFAIGTGAFVVSGVLAPLSEGLGISVAAAGQLLTVYALAYAVGSPLLISAASRFPRRHVLLAGIGLFAVANLMSALAVGFWSLFAARILAAFGAAIFTPSASAVAVATSTPKERGRALATVFLGLSLSQVIGIPLGTMVGFAFGWRAVFVLVAVFALIAAAVSAWLVPGGLDGQRVDLRAWGGILRRRQLTLALAVTMLQFTGQFVVYAYIGPWVGTSLSLSATGITAMLWCFGLASVFGGIGGGWSADRFGLMPTLVAILIGLTVAIAAISAAAGSIVGTAMAMAIWGLMGFAFNAPQQARLVGLAPEAMGVMLGLNAAALYVGTAAGGAIGGIVVGRLGMNMLGWVGAGFVALGLAALIGSTIPPARRTG